MLNIPENRHRFPFFFFLVYLEEKIGLGGLMAAYSFLMRGRGGAGAELWSLVTSDRTQENSLKL